VTTKSISKELKMVVLESVAEFNRQNFGDWEIAYIARFRGRHVYLDREEFGSKGPICRLTLSDKPNVWEFAIYKYSSQRYSPDEWFFPGSDEVDGTVDGAMRAGMKAYPV